MNSQKKFLKWMHVSNDTPVIIYSCTKRSWMKDLCDRIACCCSPLSLRITHRSISLIIHANMCKQPHLIASMKCFNIVRSHSLFMSDKEEWTCAVRYTWYSFYLLCVLNINPKTLESPGFVYITYIFDII